MRTTSILLVLVVVLGFVSEAGADYSPEIACNRSITIGQLHVGFIDWVDGYNSSDHWTVLHLGPLGEYQVPFTATQGLIGFCMIVVGMVALVTVFTFRWKWKRAT
jgi:hypothetical protein